MTVTVIFRAAKKKKKEGKDDKAKDAKDGKDAKQQAVGKGKAAPTGSNDRVGNMKSQSGGNKEDGRPESHMTHISGEDIER